LLGCISWPAISSSSLPAAAKHSKIIKSTKNQQVAFLFDSEWPPAISPSHVKFFANGYSCLLDSFGKLMTADLRRPERYKVLGELSDIGKRVLDFAMLGNLSYAIVFKQAESGDLQSAVSIIDLAKPDSPSLLGQQNLPEFSSPLSVIAAEGYLCIAGSADKGPNLVSVYKINPVGRSEAPGLRLVRSFSIKSQVQKMAIEHSRLFVLGSEGMNSSIYRTRLASVDLVAEKIADLDGEFTTMAVSGNLILAAGRADKGLEAVMVSLSPTPHPVCKQTLGNAHCVYDLIPQKNAFLLLLQRDDKLNLVGMTVDKSLTLTPEDDVTVAKFAGSSDTKACFDSYGQYINVVTGADSVYILNKQKATWSHAPAFAAPPLPTSAVSFWGNYLITAGMDLTLYDTSQPRRTHKVMSAKTEGTVRAIAVAGSYLLCQTKDSLSLRKVDTINEVIVSTKISGQRMTYDDDSNVAYIVDRQSNKTKVTPVHVYSNKLTDDKPYVLPVAYDSIAAFGDSFVLGGGNEVGLYKFGDTAQLVGNHNFPTRLVRAVSANTEYLLVAAVDHDLTGQLLVISPEPSDGSLELIGSLELPQDACALAATGNKVLIIGQSPKGYSLLSIIRIDDPSQPKIEKTTKILAQASALALKENLAVVAGRGLQILNI
jgi:hypothetical protein